MEHVRDVIAMKIPTNFQTNLLKCYPSYWAETVLAILQRYTTPKIKLVQLQGLVVIKKISDMWQPPTHMRETEYSFFSKQAYQNLLKKQEKDKQLALPCLQGYLGCW